MKILNKASTITLLAGLLHQESAWAKKGSAPTIVDIAVDDGRFTTLVKALTAADLVDTLSGKGPFTVFAPVDEAFESVPAKFLDEMYSAHLKDILTYHVIAGAEVFSDDLELDMEAETVNGESVTVTSLEPSVMINDAAEVIIPDIGASNGVIHVIDEVLLPSAATKTISDLAVATPDLSTLVDLLVAADLVDVFAGEGSFTVFAPTNDAFGKLPSEVVESLTDPANKDALVNVLSYHVIGDAIVLSSDLSEGATVDALNGDPLTVTTLTPPTINESVVVSADILASNGVIHVIDTVLIPPEE